MVLFFQKLIGSVRSLVENYKTKSNQKIYNKSNIPFISFTHWQNYPVSTLVSLLTLLRCTTTHRSPLLDADLVHGSFLLVILNWFALTITILDSCNTSFPCDSPQFSLSVTSRSAWFLWVCKASTIPFF